MPQKQFFAVPNGVGGIDIFDENKVPITSDETGAQDYEIVTGHKEVQHIKVSYFFVNKIFLNIAHHPQRKFGGENTGILSLIFF